MDDKNGPKISECKRVNRNINEKKRRDRFNVLVGELAAIISPSSRKADKTTILKQAIACLKSEKDFSSSSCRKPSEGWQPPFVSDPELCQLLVEAMYGFIISVDSMGMISFVSDNVTSQLGYLPEEMVNTRLGEYLEASYNDAMFTRLRKLQQVQVKLNRIPASNSDTVLGEMTEFCLCIAYGPLVDASGFAMLRCIAQTCMHGASHGGCETGQDMRLVILCCLETPTPTKTISIPRSNNTEFTVKLTLDWNYTHIDQRAQTVIGYMPPELIDTSVYQYVHVEDLENMSHYHKALVFKGRVTTCYYRFLTKGHVWIWLRSCCYISYNQWNSRPEYIISTNTAASQAEVSANQPRMLEHDQQQFQSLENKQMNPVSASCSGNNYPFSSSSTEMSSEVPKSQTQLSLSHMPGLFPGSSNFGITVPAIEQYTKPATSISSVLPQQEDCQGLNVMSPMSSTLEGGNANMVNRLMSSGASVSQVLDSLLQDDSGIGSDGEANNDNIVSSSRSPWDLPLPEGLSPTQYKLHKQLKDKHILLEKSIRKQIHVLNKIKKQIEINKDLWDFNKKVQKCRGPNSNLDLGTKHIPNNAIQVHNSLPSELSNLNLVSQGKPFQHFMGNVPDDYAMATSSHLQLTEPDYLSIPIPRSSASYISEDLDSTYSYSSSSALSSTNSGSIYPMYSTFDPQNR